MKAIILNGSPRKNWNTDILCRNALEGAQAARAEVELIQLYDFNYKGCISCFACHLKSSMNNLVCSYKDELTPILEKCMEADVIIIGSPVYYGFTTGMVRSFMERLLFPVDTYYTDEQGQRVTKIKRAIQTAIIYTMNANPDQMEQYHIQRKLSMNENSLKGLLGHCEALYSCDTTQFKDYSYYTNNIFDPKKKKEVHDKQFPIDCENAFHLGERLVEKARVENANLKGSV